MIKHSLMKLASMEHRLHDRDLKVCRRRNICAAQHAWMHLIILVTLIYNVV